MNNALYVHFPFCMRKCSYCDFDTVPYNEDSVDEYQEHLLKEISLWAEYDVGTVKTMYIGGGSPSLWPGRKLHRFLDRLQKQLDFSPVEFTLECNPQELIDKNLSCWETLGVDRLSVGIQSLERRILRSANREAPADLLYRLVKARERFSNVNLDFILGLPGECIKSVCGNLETIKAIGPNHVSYYMLDKDGDSDLMRLYHSGRIELLGTERVNQLHDRILEEMCAMGYVRYEVSSWQRKGSECLHNLAYWKNADYIGIGIAAGGHFGRTRYVNTSDIADYYDLLGKRNFPRDSSKCNTPCEEFLETLFMGLRLVEGVDLAEVLKDKADNVPRIKEILVKVFGPKLVFEESKVRFTSEGLDLTGRLFAGLSEYREEITSVFSSRDT